MSGEVKLKPLLDTYSQLEKNCDGKYGSKMYLKGYKKAIEDFLKTLNL